MNEPTPEETTQLYTDLAVISVSVRLTSIHGKHATFLDSVPGHQGHRFYDGFVFYDECDQCEQRLAWIRKQLEEWPK